MVSRSQSPPHIKAYTRCGIGGIVTAPSCSRAEPDSCYGRLVIGSWWLFMIVVVTCYSGYFVTFLTEIEFPTYLEKLGDSIIENFLKDSSEKIYQEILKKGHICTTDQIEPKGNHYNIIKNEPEHTRQVSRTSSLSA